MSEEEKEAIEYLKGKFEFFEEDDILAKWDYEAINTILDLIDKLQKENDKLKQDNYNLDRENQLKFDKIIKENEDMREELQMYVDTDIMKLQEENKYLREREEYLEKRRNDIINKFQNEITDTTIPKDKIKEALGDKNIPDEMILTYIETLVSENNRLEDIEDRKVQIEYNNVFNKGVKSVEDKIRAKIKELEKTKNYIISMYAIGILEELLGE